MLKQRETLLWTFLMPALFFYFIGSITGGSSSSDGGEKIALQMARNTGFLGQEVWQRLEDQGYQVHPYDVTGTLIGAPMSDLEEGQHVPTFGDYDRRLAIPEDFTERVLSGEAVSLSFEREGDTLGAALDRFRVQRATYTVLADVLAASGLAQTSDARLEDLVPADLAQLHGIERPLRMRVREAGKRERIPTGFEQAVPGTMVMFTLLILLTSGATTLVVERREGLLRRLASAPLSRGSVVLGKWLGKFVLACVQMAFAMLLGRFAFGVHWGPALPMLLLTLGAYGAMLAALGMLLGNWARSEGQAVAVGVLGANVLAALGGCWWPIEVTSPSMQKLALFLPTGWMMDAMHKLMVFQHDWSSALPHFLGMLACTWVLGLVCARSFRFE